VTEAWTGELLLELAATGVAVEEAAQRLLAEGEGTEVLGTIEDFLRALEADPSVRDRALLLLERTRVLAERAAAGEQRSERHRAEAAQLRQIGAAVGDAARLLHHELSNSLNVAAVALDMLELPSGGPAPEELISMARRHVRLAARLLDTWGRAERLQAGAIEVSWDEVDLGGLVRECVADVGLTGVPHEYSVSVERPVVVPADADALRQVVLNLVTNAAKFSPGESRIDVSVTETGAYAEVTVRDRGPGVAPRDAERIFEAGQRADTHVPGLGLGLFVARQLVLAHGGELQVSDADPGARFVCRIPLSGVGWRRSLQRREEALTAGEARQQRRDAVGDDRDAELDQRENVAAARDEALDARGALADERDDALDQREADAARDAALDRNDDS
jgi:signal transduction histidine kinase